MNRWALFGALTLGVVVVGIGSIWGTSVACQASYLQYVLGRGDTPPRCFIGRNVTFGNESFFACDSDLPTGLEDERVAQVVLEVSLPRLYDNLWQGCLDNVDWRRGEDVPAIRKEYMELLTIADLTILCDSGVCPGKSGYAAVRDDWVHICPSNYRDDDEPQQNPGITTHVLGHEIVHLALWPGVDPPNEGYPTADMTTACAPNPNL